MEINYNEYINNIIQEQKYQLNNLSKNRKTTSDIENTISQLKNNNIISEKDRHLNNTNNHYQLNSSYNSNQNEKRFLTIQEMPDNLSKH